MIHIMIQVFRAREEVYIPTVHGGNCWTCHDISTDRFAWFCYMV